MEIPIQVVNIHNDNIDEIELNKCRLRDDIILKHQDDLHNTLFLEFGVMYGISMNIFVEIYEKYKISDVLFFGFDSWQGLPKEEKDVGFQSNWVEGSFKGSVLPDTLQKFHNKTNVFLVDGWFKDTLTTNLIQRFGNKKVGIVHIDCDIYSSAIEVLEFLLDNRLLQKGSLIIYDDWGGYLEKLGEGHEFECGEGRAHREMMTKYNLETKFLTKYILHEKWYEITVFQVVSDIL